MAWNWMQLELSGADMLGRPAIGDGGLTRDQAHAEVQTILDKAAQRNRTLADTAATWRRGAKDDTVYASTPDGMLVWAIYEHPDGEDPRRAALAWLDDFANTMRRAGLSVGIAQLPN